MLPTTSFGRACSRLQHSSYVTFVLRQCYPTTRQSFNRQSDPMSVYSTEPTALRAVFLVFRPRVFFGYSTTTPQTRYKFKTINSKNIIRQPSKCMYGKWVRSCLLAHTWDKPVVRAKTRLALFVNGKFFILGLSPSSRPMGNLSVAAHNNIGRGCFFRWMARESKKRS